MKRSKMVNTMVFNWCENINKTNEHKSLETAMGELLDSMVDAGMLPPSSFWKRDKNGHIIPDNTWEPEDG